MTFVPTVLVGPSGVGKGTILSRLREQYAAVWLSVSVTTRPPRPGETEGLSYFFLTEAAFDAMIAADGLLEWARYSSARYGTPREPVEAHIREGRAVIMELDIQGARQVQQRLHPVRTVFVAPPSFAELERRLRGRGTESETVIEQRLATARRELASQGECDHIIVNTEVATAVAQLVDLIGLAADGARTHEKD